MISPLTGSPAAFSRAASAAALAGRCGAAEVLVLGAAPGAALDDGALLHPASTRAATAIALVIILIGHPRSSAGPQHVTPGLCARGDLCQKPARTCPSRCAGSSRWAAYVCGGEGAGPAAAEAWAPLVEWPPDLQLVGRLVPSWSRARVENNERQRTLVNGKSAAQNSC